MARAAFWAGSVIACLGIWAFVVLAFIALAS